MLDWIVARLKQYVWPPHALSWYRRCVGGGLAWMCCHPFMQVGIDYKYKFIEIDGKKVRLEIWDTAGKERFKTITPSFLRGCQGILFVYDVADSNSYEHVSEMMLKHFADLNVVKVLVGNKCDPEQRRTVKHEDGQNLVR